MANQDDKDIFTEVSSESWTERIVSSLKGILFGLVFLLIATILLYWNEGRAVRTYEGLKEGSKSVKTISADLIDAKNEGRLVHLSGHTTTSEIVKDPVFQISSDGLMISRTSQILQWIEKEQTSTSNGTAGSKNTQKTYTYEKVWSNFAINSSTFQHPEGHSNLGEMKFPSAEFLNPQSKIGEFALPPILIRKLEASQNLTVTDAHLQNVEPSIRNNLKLFGGGLYYGANPSAPQIGDISIHFSQTPNGPVTLVGRQASSTIEAFETKSGSELFFIRDGIQSSQNIFKDEQNTNLNWTWGLRAGGFALMVLGFYLLMRPLVIIADFFPILGEILSTGSFAVALLISIILSCVIIGLGWAAHRPIIGIPLLIVAASAAYYMIALRPKRSQPENHNSKMAA